MAQILHSPTKKQPDMSAKELQYSLHTIKKLTSYLNSLDTLPISNLKEEKIGVRKGFQLGFNEATGKLTIKVMTDFLCRPEDSEPVKLFGATILCESLFLNFHDIVKKTNETQVEIPDDLLVTLMSVSYSSARGILAELTAGTDYFNILLPLVNPQDFKTILKTAEKQTEAK